MGSDCILCLGNIAAWKKGEGDEVAAGDSIAEVETDKVAPAPLQHLLPPLCHIGSKYLQEWHSLCLLPVLSALNRQRNLSERV